MRNKRFGQGEFSSKTVGKGKERPVSDRKSQAVQQRSYRAFKVS